MEERGNHQANQHTQSEEISHWGKPDQSNEAGCGYKKKASQIPAHWKLVVADTRMVAVIVFHGFAPMAALIVLLLASKRQGVTYHRCANKPSLGYSALLDEIIV